MIATRLSTIHDDLLAGPAWTDAAAGCGRVCWPGDSPDRLDTEAIVRPHSVRAAPSARKVQASEGAAYRRRSAESHGRQQRLARV